eukprot:TRINITY_DN30909_c0_g1_i1.p1 TRINITY_DN30909_c0_g1~~TRINITY_DN30909_c0_g1_i1.p1  ORF type:complete len:382 (+),score=77.39 TRINITY_DN30909_c0_g1_i1:89-1234(+)
MAAVISGSQEVGGARVAESDFGTRTGVCDQTVLLSEAVGARDELLARSSAEAPALALVSLNSRKTDSVEFTKGFFAGPDASMEISFGRGGENSVVLEDPRVSLKHFTIVQLPEASDELGGSASLRVELVDESLNGTWVNGVLVGKGQRRLLDDGDRIFVLPAAKVGQQDMIGFAVVLAGAPTKVPEPKVVAKEESPVKARVHAEAEKLLTVGLQCRLCGESPMFRCATAAPCGHNFDLGCFLAWRHSSAGCPVCGDPVRQLVRNRSVDRVAETFLTSRPGAKRDERTLRLLEQVEQDPTTAAMLVRLLHGVAVPTNPHLFGVDPARAGVEAGLPPHLGHLAPFAGDRPAVEGPAEWLDGGRSRRSGRSRSGDHMSSACAVS